MAGHSKWANIKRKKSAEDERKGKLFTKLVRDITVAAREGGDNLNTNFNLRSAVEAAKTANMPNKSIKRAISRGVGNLDGNRVVEVSYEGYGPSGEAILLKCLTDNKNRTVADIRNTFSRAGGSLGETGSVAYLFNKQYVPSYRMELKPNQLETFQKLLDDLDEIDDVVELYHNVTFHN